MIKKKVKIVKVSSRNAMRPKDFFRRNKISKTTYYALKAAGLGPKEMRIGSSIRIS